MGTSKEIAQTTIDGGADDVLAQKGNGPATYAKVENVFADPRSTLALQSFTTVNGDHGWIKTRRHTICHNIEWLLSDRRYSAEFLLLGLAANSSGVTDSAVRGRPSPSPIGSRRHYAPKWVSVTVRYCPSR
jgi:hypothetical protein